MDLSKAFDCLPHDLLIHKLNAYGLSDPASTLILDYLSNRKQCVKLGNSTSPWAEITKGVPQGSILGPLLFNVFINDIFFFVDRSSLYNYADDNTLTYAHKDPAVLREVLESDSCGLINWFAENNMKANPDKFQVLAIGTKSQKLDLEFNLGQTTLTCDKEVKLLGVTVDFKLSFKPHISNICKKASRQLNVLNRIGKHLNLQCRLMIYHSFILSNFNYCPLIWHFCSKQDTQKMEKIQERALRFIYNDYSHDYTTLLHKSKLPSLHIRRLRIMAGEVFKIINKEGPRYLHNIIKTKQTHYSFRYNTTAVIPQVRTTTHGLKSFSYAAAKLWNSLPDKIRQASSFGMFKNMINAWCGEECKCSACC